MYIAFGLGYIRPIKSVVVGSLRHKNRVGESEENVFYLDESLFLRVHLRDNLT